MRDNDTITRKGRAEINFALRKNGGYMLGNLGSRLINVGRQ